MRTVVVLSGGPGATPADVPSDLEVVLRGAVQVVAADGGLHLAGPLGLTADVVVGDMDSVAPALLDAAAAGGAEVVRHPADKDATDLELAMELAVAAGPDRVVVVGSASGRLDHLLGTVGVLASERWAAVEVDAWLGGATVHVVRGRRTVVGEPGATVSLLAHGAGATGVTTTGLRWPLTDDRLDPGSARGVSNEFRSVSATVEVADGCVVVVRPGADLPDGTTCGSTAGSTADGTDDGADDTMEHTEVSR